MNRLGTVDYCSEDVNIRRVIEVIPRQSPLFTVEAISNGLAQTCAFPLTFNAINDTNCTSINDATRRRRTPR